MFPQLLEIYKQLSVWVWAQSPTPISQLRYRLLLPFWAPGQVPSAHFWKGFVLRNAPKTRWNTLKLPPDLHWHPEISRAYSRAPLGIFHCFVVWEDQEKAGSTHRKLCCHAVFGTALETLVFFGEAGLEIPSDSQLFLTHLYSIGVGVYLTHRA